MKKFVGFKRILAILAVVILLTGMISISAFAQYRVGDPEHDFNYGNFDKTPIEHHERDLNFHQALEDTLRVAEEEGDIQLAEEIRQMMEAGIGSGTTISEGNWWIIAIGTAVIIGGIAAIIIVCKKKKKSEIADNEKKETKESEN